MRFDALAQRRKLERMIDDFRMGTLCSLVANAVSGRKGRTYRPDHFFATCRELLRKRVQTPEEMLKIVEGMQAEFDLAEKKEKGLRDRNG